MSSVAKTNQVAKPISMAELLKHRTVQDQINEQLPSLDPSKSEECITVEYNGMLFQIKLFPIQGKGE